MRDEVSDEGGSDWGHCGIPLQTPLTVSALPEYRRAAPGRQTPGGKAGSRKVVRHFSFITADIRAF